MPGDYYPCWRCGNPAENGLDTYTQFFIAFCAFCGYFFHRRPVYVRGSNNFKLTKDGRRIFRHKEQGGFGVECYTTTDGDTRYNNFKNPVTPQDIDQFYERLKAGDIDPERSYLTRWDEDAKKVIVVFGKVLEPESGLPFEDRHYKEAEENIDLDWG